jgi:hypothetical protein
VAADTRMRRTASNARQRAPMVAKRWLRRGTQILRGHPIFTFLLMGVFFLLFGCTSINLYVTLRANVDLFLQYGLMVIDDGALTQLAQIIGSMCLSIFFFILFAICERILVGRLTAALRDEGSTNTPRV